MKHIWKNTQETDLGSYFCFVFLIFSFSYFFFFFFSLFFGPTTSACGILVPQPGIEPQAPRIGSLEF